MMTKSQSIARTFSSLVQSTHDAGGEPELKRVLNMTVFDFIMEIAGPNNIAFVFIKTYEDTVLHD